MPVSLFYYSFKPWVMRYPWNLFFIVLLFIIIFNRRLERVVLNLPDFFCLIRRNSVFHELFFHYFDKLFLLFLLCGIENTFNLIFNPLYLNPYFLIVILISTTNLYGINDICTCISSPQN